MYKLRDIEGVSLTTKHSLLRVFVELFRGDRYLIIYVKGNVIYTNEVGLVVGAKATTLKKITKATGIKYKVRQLQLSEEDWCMVLNKENRARAFSEAMAKGYSKLLKQMAEQWNDETCNMWENKQLGYHLHFMGYSPVGFLPRHKTVEDFYIKTNPFRYMKVDKWVRTRVAERCNLHPAMIDKL